MDERQMWTEAPSELGQALMLRETPSEVAGESMKSQADGVVEGWVGEWMRNPMQVLVRSAVVFVALVFVWV